MDKAEQATMLGAIAELWRYPVKSMQGEAIPDAPLEARGLAGDRGYAVIDQATGNIVSAKNPRKWQALWRCHAAYVEPPRLGAILPPVCIKLPDGSTIRSDQPDVHRVLSALTGRDVVLSTIAPAAPQRETLAVDADTPAEQADVRVDPFALAAPGTFFDFAPMHILTTATLRQLHSLAPDARWDVRRFRPNIVVATDPVVQGFVENDWLGCRLDIGGAALDIVDPAPRCVVTTLANDDLPHDPSILRTVARHNNVASHTFMPGVVFPAVVGVYAQVVGVGNVVRGDRVMLYT